MLFIYLLEGHAGFSKRVEYLLQRSYERNDTLCTSFLAYGEILAGAVGSQEKTDKIQKTVKAMGFEFLPFGAGAVLPFSRLRAVSKVRVADAIHLSTAAAAGIDLFLTGDKQLLRLNVPGVQFIADFNSAPL